MLNLASKKFFQVPRVHADKPSIGIGMCNDKTIFSIGSDCQVREWPTSETWDKIPA